MRQRANLRGRTLRGLGSASSDPEVKEFNAAPAPAQFSRFRGTAYKDGFLQTVLAPMPPRDHRHSTSNVPLLLFYLRVDFADALAHHNAWQFLFRPMPVLFESQNYLLPMAFEPPNDLVPTPCTPFALTLPNCRWRFLFLKGTLL